MAASDLPPFSGKRKKRRRALLRTIGERVAPLGLWLLHRTLRFERIGEEHWQRYRREGTPVIYLLWHGSLLPLLLDRGDEGIVVLVSEHRDGEIVARLLHRYGFGTVRGSSTRGAVAGLRGFVRAARSGSDVALTPDGPRGPALLLKEGALLPARLLGLPIVPIGVGTARSWRLRSWDRFLVPKPFARIRIEYGEPIFLPRPEEGLDPEEERVRIEGALRDVAKRSGFMDEVGRGPVDERNAAADGDVEGRTG